MTNKICKNCGQSLPPEPECPVEYNDEFGFKHGKNLITFEVAVAIAFKYGVEQKFIQTFSESGLLFKIVTDDSTSYCSTVEFAVRTLWPSVFGGIEVEDA